MVIIKHMICHHYFLKYWKKRENSEELQCFNKTASSEAVKDLFAMNDMLSEWEALPGYIPTSTEYRYTASILDMYDICISHIDIQSSVKTFLSEEYQNTQQLDEEALQSEKVSMLRVFSQEYGRFYKLKIRQDGTINNQSFQDDKSFISVGICLRNFNRFMKFFSTFSLT